MHTCKLNHYSFLEYITVLISVWSFQSTEFYKYSTNVSIAPYILARTWSSLDHITRGRIGWNVVTSYSNSAAKAMGKDRVPPSHERYEAAEEFLDLTYQ